MSEFSDLMSTGFAGCAGSAGQIGCIVVWRGCQLAAVRGAVEAFDFVEPGGITHDDGGYFLIDRAVIAAAKPGQMIKQEEALQCAGVSYKVKAIESDLADPIIRIIVQGPQQ